MLSRRFLCQQGQINCRFITATLRPQFRCQVSRRYSIDRTKCSAPTGKSCRSKEKKSQNSCSRQKFHDVWIPLSNMMVCVQFQTGYLRSTAQSILTVITVGAALAVGNLAGSMIISVSGVRILKRLMRSRHGYLFIGDPISGLRKSRPVSCKPLVCPHMPLDRSIMSFPVFRGSDSRNQAATSQCEVFISLNVALSKIVIVRTLLCFHLRQ